MRRRAPVGRPVPTGANDVLERLAGLPVSAWTYGFEDPSVRHLGPMAQDFAETFGLGSSPKAISVIDANGVCMASIQALYRRLVEVEEQLEQLRAAQEHNHSL
ncbi:tail fiber domain-containing protein [Antrihabitans sp. YC2-6]|uniref:tail fiber domain-containing protein n=1 Tax=Antrihabitans sp. YC2-6 TaxID=2799498 RepID=UPI001F1CE333|nr:tail fiber domain-containing protein [Antrihabitans sp. YC2-6]